MSDVALTQAVESFLLAETWEASRAVVAVEPDLLGDGAQTLLSDLAKRARQAGDERSAELFEWHREILERSARDGIDAAFSDLVGGDGSPPDLDALFSELAHQAGTPAEVPRRIELCRQALAQVSREDDPELWALLQAALGTALMVSTVGDPEQNVEASIEALEAAAAEFCRQELRVECARTWNNLGLALEARLHDGDQERAIEAYKAALEVFVDPDLATERAETLNNLANAYGRLRHGGLHENRGLAIELYEEALDLIGDTVSSIWVRTRLNLGVALVEQLRGDPLPNLDRAIEAFGEALANVSPTEDPTTWAHLQANLGNARTRRAGITGSGEDLELAIVAYESALEVYGDLRAPLNRALTLSNLGNALLAGDVAPSEAKVERAIGCYREALQILDPATSPLDWAQAQNNLGRAYRKRLSGDPRENLESAIAAFRDAAGVLSARTAPIEYAQVLKNLGTAYRHRFAGDRTENLEEAMRAYGIALEIRTDVYGADHPRVASCLYSMAKAQQSAHDYEGARASLERAIAIDEAWSEVPDERVARSYRRLAAAARELGDLDAAERAIERALEIDEDIFGPDHPSVFKDLRELALIRDEMGQRTGALDALEEALTIEELSSTGTHRGAREALTTLGELLRGAGDLAGAEQTMERAVELDEAFFGPGHPRVADSLVRLAEILHESHQVTRAEATLERAAAIEKTAEGRVSPRVAAALATVASMIDHGVPAEPAPSAPVAPPQPAPPAPAPASAVRLRFAERFRGYIGFEADDPETGLSLGRRSGTRLELDLQTDIEDVDRFFAESSQVGVVSGRAWCDALGGEGVVREGRYEIRFGRSGTTGRTIAYRLEVEGEVDYRVEGHRTIDEDNDPDLLRKALSLDVRIETGDGRAACGMVAVRHLDFLRQLRAIDVDAPTPAGRLSAVDRFARASLGPLWEFHERRGAQLAEGA
jgi:tetratricopeptide (TPR) repeat protein